MNWYKRVTLTTKLHHLAMRLGSSYLHSMATVRTVGQIKEFNPNEECIAAYLNRFDPYIAVNKIDEAVQASMFLLVVGRQHYSLLWDLVAPDKPKNK